MFDPVPVLADRILEFLADPPTDGVVASGALALALSVVLRTMHEQTHAPAHVVAMVDDLAHFAGEASEALARHRTTLQ